MEYTYKMDLKGPKMIKKEHFDTDWFHLQHREIIIYRSPRDIGDRPIDNYHSVTYISWRCRWNQSLKMKLKIFLWFFKETVFKRATSVWYILLLWWARDKLQNRISNIEGFLSNCCLVHSRSTQFRVCVEPLWFGHTCVCSAPRLIRTCFELDLDETEAMSLFLGFFRLDLKGPWALPEKSKVIFKKLFF